MSLTDRQQRAVRSPGGVAITAGAGTGKTHTLGHRYLAHLEGGLSPLAVVAVTFTERAAHELRARVRAYARAAFERDDPRLAELEAAPIGTVHALCLRICRDHPGPAELPPDVRILDPLEGDVWWAERLERALERLPVDLFEALPYERVRDALAVLLRDPYRAERALAHGQGRWSELVADARAAAREAWLSPAELDAAERTLASLPARPDGDAGERTRRDALAALAAARAGAADEAASRAHDRRARVGSKRAWGGDQDALRSALATVLNGVRGWLRDPRASLELGPADDRLADLLPHLRAGFEAARDELAQAKRRAGVLDFADLEVAALRALRDPAVVAHYRSRWSALLVDEVQDTSPVQEAILLELSRFCRTTLVGDAKQSIYGFRGADAAVFRRMTERAVRAGGGSVTLDVSFRTHGGLVSATNRVFEAVLGEDHEPLEALAPDPWPAAAPLRWWTVEAPSGTPAGLRRLAEANRIADEIRSSLEAGVEVRDDAAPGGRRPLHAGDVAVLARSWAPLDLLAEILPARGIPAVHTGGGDLLGTREAQDGTAALRALADPDDDVALVAVLRGPAFAVSDADLETFAERVRDDEAEERRSWWRILQERRPPWAASALATIDALREAARHDPPSRLLQLLDRATGWSAVVANLPGGPRRLADLDGFVELVRQLERGSDDVFAVTRRIRRLLRAGVSVDRPALEAEGAVTLTTIHRAKGLEWPMVVVAALDARGRPGGPALRMHPDLGVAVQVEDATDAKVRPAAWTLLQLVDEEAELAEDRRLMYVALTRAADIAVVSSAGPSGRYVDLLAPGLDRAEVAAEAIAFDPADARWPEPPLPEPDDAETDGDAVADADADASTAFTAVDARTVATGQVLADAASPAAPDAVSSSGSDAATEAATDAATDAVERRWRRARAWVAAVAPELEELVDALRAAKVPPPDPDGSVRPSRRGEEGRALLAWSTPAGAVVLLEPGSTGGDGVRRLAPNLLDLAATRDRLLRALRKETG